MGIGKAKPIKECGGGRGHFHLAPSGPEFPPPAQGACVTRDRQDNLESHSILPAGHTSCPYTHTAALPHYEITLFRKCHWGYTLGSLLPNHVTASESHSFQHMYPTLSFVLITRP